MNEVEGVRGAEPRSESDGVSGGEQRYTLREMVREGPPAEGVGSEDDQSNKKATDGSDTRSIPRRWNELGYDGQDATLHIFGALKVGDMRRDEDGDLCRKDSAWYLDPSLLPPAQREDLIRSVNNAREATSTDPDRYPEVLREQLGAVNLTMDDVMACSGERQIWVKLPDLTDRQREGLGSIVQEARDTGKSVYELLEERYAIRGEDVREWLDGGASPFTDNTGF
ncbi:MAG: hypothetical protein J2P37_35765 [Ktedonobacteraceae bacterium]|nr:hypothetical protein [Ktedonobacteraceae bacterium]